MLSVLNTSHLTVDSKEDKISTISSDTSLITEMEYQVMSSTKTLTETSLTDENFVNTKTTYEKFCDL